MAEEQKPKELTAAEAAKRVKRPVTELVDGKEGESKVARVKKVAVDAAEVLSFRDYGGYVVVVRRWGNRSSWTTGRRRRQHRHRAVRA